MSSERINWRNLHKRSRIRGLTPPQSKGEGEDIVIHTDGQKEGEQEKKPIFRNPAIVGESVFSDPPDNENLIPETQEQHAAE